MTQGDNGVSDEVEAGGRTKPVAPLVGVVLYGPLVDSTT